MKVLFDMARGQISIEGDGPELIAVLQQAREIAPKLSEIRLITSPAIGGGSSPPVDRNTNKQDIDINPENKGGVPTLREFVKKVSPTTAADKIITLAFYRSRYHQQEAFSPREMADWFTHAGLEQPAQMPSAIFATKARFGYLESSGHARWKLTVTGQNAVIRKLESEA